MHEVWPGLEREVTLDGDRGTGGGRSIQSTCRHPVCMCMDGCRMTSGLFIICANRTELGLGSCCFYYFLLPVQDLQELFKIPRWMLLKVFWTCVPVIRDPTVIWRDKRDGKKKELWLLRKLNTTFPVITFSRLKLHAHCRIFLTAVCTCQKVLKEYKTRVLGVPGDSRLW